MSTLQIKETKKSREFSRSLFVVEDVPEGAVLTPQNIRAIRPGFGLHPQFYTEILGKKAARTLTRGEPLTWEMMA